MKKYMTRTLVSGAALSLLAAGMIVPSFAYQGFPGYYPPMVPPQQNVTYPGQYPGAYPVVDQTQQPITLPTYPGVTLPQQPGTGTYIGEAKAKEIALAHAGVDATQVSWIVVWQDYEHGTLVYDVEFFSGNKEYDYDIDAVTGAVLSFDQDIEWYPGGGASQQPTADIGAEKAKQIALNHAGVAAADTAFIYAQLDYDHGMRVYEVEFFSGNKEYDYDIDAATGAVLSFDFDIEWYTLPSSSQSNYIGEAKAKQIVEQAAGTTGIFTEFKLEADDGRVVYEGELRSGWMEYEFEVDALTGAILDWDADWDD